MSACSLFDRVTMIPTNNPQGGGGGEFVTKRLNGVNGVSIQDVESSVTTLERDYYGCYCLKFIVKNGTHITEEKVLEDFGQFGEVVDVRGPGLFSGLRGNHVYVRFIDKTDAEGALKQLTGKYHQLTPASISDVLPDNYGLYTISFYNKTGIPSSEVRKEFSKFGEVKNLTGSLDVKGGRVFVSYKEKNSAVQALQAFFFRKDKYPNMKFALPRCEKDYFGCYCLKFYNKSGDVTEEKVLRDFGQFGEVVDVRGPGLFDVNGDDVYVRYKEKSSAEQALIELVGKYDSLCLAPPSDIQADKFGYYTITFVNDKCLSKSDVWYIFSKFGTVACVNGTFDCKKGRVFVSYKEKQGALNALETMLITKEYHLQVSKNSTVRKNDYNVVNSSAKDESRMADDDNILSALNNSSHRNNMENKKGDHNIPAAVRHQRESSRGRGGVVEALPPMPPPPQQSIPPPSLANIIPGLPPFDKAMAAAKNNGLVKFNRNVEKDIFGYFCLSFLNEDGTINEKKVRHDFGKFGEVVSVRGALGKQKGHVFVRFRKKEAAENCLNCLNSFPLSEMSELFGKYLFLSPATPRDIDCDMYGLYSISFLNLNMKSFREIRQEFSKFGEIVRLTSGGGGNTDELVSISYSDKTSAIKALQTHFTNKEYPYLDIAKGSSLLLVNSSDSSDNEDNEADYVHRAMRDHRQQQAAAVAAAQAAAVAAAHAADPFHDPIKNGQLGGGSSDVVDELLKPFQSYFSIYRTGQYQHQNHSSGMDDFMSNGRDVTHHRSPEKKYRIKSVKSPTNSAKPMRSHGSHGDLENGVNGFNGNMDIPPPAILMPNTQAPPPHLPPQMLVIPPQQPQQQPQQPPPMEEVPPPSEPPVAEPIDLRPDVFGFYSISFANRSKDSTDRRVRLDFGKLGGEVCRVRGNLGAVGEPVVVSFPDRRTAEQALVNGVAKYPDMSPAAPMGVVADKDGLFSIEFINSGMSGIREITNEFSRHGEVMKVMQGGAKNAVKKVTVSYAEEEAAVKAVKAYANSKDFLGVDLTKECLLSS